jgi:hypothetical protein
MAVTALLKLASFTHDLCYVHLAHRSLAQIRRRSRSRSDCRRSWSTDDLVLYRANMPRVVSRDGLAAELTCRGGG